MPKAKYEQIYKDIKYKIESGIYPGQELIPPENTLVKIYDCSRNTVRRAIAQLVTDGYVQTIQGKGVRSIYRPIEHTAFTIGEIESFRESVARNGQTSRTEVLLFTEIMTGSALSERTGFPDGSPLYYIQRLHYINDQPLILNHNYFLKSAVPGLTPEIATHSIYDYLENTVHMTIVNSRRIFTVEKVTDTDTRYMDLNTEEYNCVAVVSSLTYNSDGIMFEYTQSRHRPDYFSFQDNAVRKNI